MIYSLKATDRNTRWKCKICWKLTIKKPEQSQWRHSGVLTFNSKHISHYALVFLVFLLLTLNSLDKILASKKSHRSKKRWYRSFAVRKKYWFIVVRDELRTCDISKMVFFAKIVYSLQSLTILTRSSVFRSLTWCWVCLAYFFRFTFIIDLFSSLNIFKY